jgi:hypothetical protein
MVSPPPTLKSDDCGCESGNATPGSSFKAKAPACAGLPVVEPEFSASLARVKGETNSNAVAVMAILAGCAS